MKKEAEAIKRICEMREEVSKWRGIVDDSRSGLAVMKVLFLVTAWCAPEVMIEMASSISIGKISMALVI